MIILIVYITVLQRRIFMPFRNHLSGSIGDVACKSSRCQPAIRRFLPVTGRKAVRALLVNLLLLVANAVGAVDCGGRAADASRIAVAGGSLTEILYALDEADRIIAVDTTSNFPPAATELTQIGYVRNLSAEGLLSVKPTLVLSEHDMGPPAVLDQIGRAHV
jgi:ABC-type hemin transport system substrate-binding protein